MKATTPSIRLRIYLFALTNANSEPQFDKPKTEVVAQKIYELTELQNQEKFKAKRDKNVLSTALGTKKHGGRIRGVSSKLTLKDGFQQDQASYRRHDRYKEEMKEAAEKALQESLRIFPCTIGRAAAVRAIMDCPIARGGATTDPDDALSGIGPSEYGMFSEQCHLYHSTIIPSRSHNKYYSMLVALSDRQS